MHKFLLLTLIFSTLHALDFKAAVEQSFQYSQELAREVQMRDSSKVEMDFAWTQLLPQPHYSFDMNKTDPNMLQVQVPLFDPAKWADVVLNKKSSKVLDTQFEMFKQDFVLRLLKSYLAVLDKDKHLKALLEEQLVSERLVSELRVKLKAGIVARVDLSEAVAKLEQIKSKVFSYRADFDLARAHLKIFFPEQFDEMHDIAQDVMLDDVFDFLSSYENTSPSLQSQLSHQKLKIAALKHDSSALMFLPKVSYAVNYSVEEETTISTQAVLVQPLDFRAISRTKSLKYAYQAAIHQKKQAAIEESFKKSEYELKIRSHLAQIRAQKNVQDSLKEKLRTVQASFDAGTRTTVEVLDAQSAFINSGKDLYTLKYRCLESLFQYAQYLGLQQEEIVQLIHLKLNKELLF